MLSARAARPMPRWCAFANDYVREHITHGYAVTVHSAQGVTADATYAVLSETATRALSYVALTRGRDTNTVYLYQRTNEHEHRPEQPDHVQVMQRGTTHHAGHLIRALIANHDNQLITATRHRRPIREYPVARTSSKPPSPQNRSGPPSPRGLPTLASRNTLLYASDGRGSGAPRRAQPRPRSRLRDRDLIQLGPRGILNQHEAEVRSFSTAIETAAERLADLPVVRDGSVSFSITEITAVRFR
jgi:hypothetical protein